MSDLFDDYESMGDDVGLDEEGKRVASNQQEWLKMTKGQILRMAFAYFHPVDHNVVAQKMQVAKEAGQTLSLEKRREIGRKVLERLAGELKKPLEQLTLVDRLDLREVKFRQFSAHYAQGLGFVHSRLGMDGPEGDAVWKRLDEPKQYFTTLALIYPANARGDLRPEDTSKLAEVRLLPWRMSRGMFMNIWKHNAGLQSNGLSIASQDFKAECTEAGYQKIEISLAGPAIWQRDPAYKKAILEKAVGMYDKLDPFRTMSTDQLRAKLGLGGSPLSDVSMTPGNFSTSSYADVLSEVEDV
jgi:hypothetical protein